MNITKAIAVRQLGKGHRKKLIPAREIVHAIVALVTRNDPTEGTIRHEVHKLGKDSPINCHAITSLKVDTKNKKSTLKDMAAVESRTGKNRSNEFIQKNLEEFHLKLTGHY
jgi:hypothetical protein